jgi:hypothetical protein
MRVTREEGRVTATRRDVQNGYRLSHPRRYQSRLRVVSPLSSCCARWTALPASVLVSTPRSPASRRGPGGRAGPDVMIDDANGVTGHAVTPGSSVRIWLASRSLLDGAGDGFSVQTRTIAFSRVVSVMIPTVPTLAGSRCLVRSAGCGAAVASSAPETTTTPRPISRRSDPSPRNSSASRGRRSTGFSDEVGPVGQASPSLSTVSLILAIAKP